MARRRAHCGFTLLELVVTLTIIALVASLALPKLTGDDAIRLASMTSILRSDIEMARVMTVANPEDPVIVAFDAANGRYWLERESAPGIPMPHPMTGDPYEVVLGVGRASTATDMTMTIVDIPSGLLLFNAQGGLRNFSLNPTITLTRGNRWVRLSIAATTGTMTEAEGEGTPPS